MKLRRIGKLLFRPTPVEQLIAECFAPPPPPPKRRRTDVNHDVMNVARLLREEDAEKAVDGRAGGRPRPGLGPKAMRKARRRAGRAA